MTESAQRPIVVQKYGGSSLATLEKVAAVADRVAATVAAGYRVVAVVSAMGKTTDGLLTQAKELSQNPAPRELDMLMSVGERISTALLAIALEERGHRAVSFTGSQSGIITTARHNRARIVEVRPWRLLDELDAGKIIVVAGYQGVSYGREITTLGRGGTDTTAVALAAALGAEHCEICSDVDGVYTADPRLAPDATRLPELSHGEMVALARSGSKVLNQDCVEYASRMGVAIYAKSTFGPRDDAGTVVRLNPAPTPRPVTALAHRKRVLELRLEPGHEPTALLELMERSGAFPHALQGGGSEPLHALVPTDDAHRVKALLESLRGHFGQALAIREDRGTVTAIGTGLGEEPQVQKQALAIVAELAGADYRVVLGPLELGFVLPSERVEAAVQALHAALLGA
ncbi:MAG: aspartate kinase [Myxococcales bacterium]|nr:aspartate kinase [Myxococcales bacterium]